VRSGGDTPLSAGRRRATRSRPVMDFADHSPRPAGRPRADVRVRAAVPGDVPAYAALLSAYDGRPDAEHRERLRRRLRTGAVLVAEVAGTFAGAGRVTWLEPAGDRPPPSGHYLVGLIVDPGRRRAGVGEALTRARVDWALARADAVWYFANAGNRASLDLHARLGFEEVTRDFEVPGVTFDGGEGVLARATAASVQRAAQAGGSHGSSFS
jgi:GNAT superfamily N-acetyltransferase